MNGVHNVKVAYCGCTHSLPRWKQLVRGDLFPATDKRCTTAVTFDLLECYMDLTHTAKVNVYKFYMGILRRSNRLGVAHNLVGKPLFLCSAVTDDYTSDHSLPLSTWLSRSGVTLPIICALVAATVTPALKALSLVT
jgi:hypothetical protein